MKDKTLRKILAGNTSSDMYDPSDSRTTTWNFPSNGIEARREITYPASDGLILYFIRRIEKLEDKVALLERKQK